MFFNYVWEVADAILFIQGRLHFHTPDGKRGKTNSGGPSVLIAYGPEAVGRLVVANATGKIKGKFIRLK